MTQGTTRSRGCDHFGSTGSSRQPPCCGGTPPLPRKRSTPATMPAADRAKMARRIIFTVGLHRIELWTSSLSGMRSNRLSYSPESRDRKRLKALPKPHVIGTLGRTSTCSFASFSVSSTMLETPSYSLKGKAHRNSSAVWTTPLATTQHGRNGEALTEAATRRAVRAKHFVVWRRREGCWGVRRVLRQKGGLGRGRNWFGFKRSIRGRYLRPPELR